MHPIFLEMQAIERESANLMHKAARITRSGDNRRLPGLRKQVEKAEKRLEALRQVVLRQQAAESTPAFFRKSYALEMFTEKLLRSRRNRNVA